MGKQRNVAGDGDHIAFQVGEAHGPEKADADGGRKADKGRAGKGGNVAAGNAKIGQQVDGDLNLDGPINISFRR